VASTSSACQDCHARRVRAELGVSRCVAPLCRVRRGRHEFGTRGQDGCSSDCNCVVPPCLLQCHSLTAAPTLCCAVAAVAAGLTVPAPVPLTTSPPAPTTALRCAALRCSALLCLASGRPCIVESLCNGMTVLADARASSRTGACLEWAFAAASDCPPVNPSSTTASARGVAGQGP
jgi:hypothetical protein